MSFESDIILVFIEPLFPSDHETLPVVIEVPNFIGNLMIMVADAWLLPVQEVLLTLNGRPLPAGDHFSDHNIVNGSTIQCSLLRPRMRRRLLLRL